MPATSRSTQISVPLPPWRLPALALVVHLATGCGSAGEPDAPPDPPRPLRRYTIAQFLGTTTYGGASFSPDASKVLTHSDATGVFNLYALPVGGGEAVALTHSTTDSAFSVGYFPDDERILYRADQGGNELDHLYVREVDGRARDLTPGDGHRAVFHGWADDERSFYLGTNERDERFFDIYEVDATTYRRNLIFQNDQGLDFADASPDGRWLALYKTHSTVNADLYLLDRRTGQFECLTEHEGNIAYLPLSFAPTGRRLLFLTDEGHEFQYLVERDLATGVARVLERPPWDILFAEYSKSGRYLVVGINVDARTQVRVIDTSTGRDLSLSQLPNAEITAIEIAPDEASMAFYASSSRSPQDLFVQVLPDGQPRQLTYSLSAEIDPADLVEPEVVRFRSFDGLEVAGLLYRPHEASHSRPAPALIWVHGGPGGQSRVGYSALVQYLVNHGYAIYAINHRGSGGYGKTFYQLDDRAHGEGDLDDCVAGRGMLAATGWVDRERIGILGGSYGGYMVLAALTFRPDAFALGVDLFGISNWVRTVQSIPPWWESFRAALQEEMGDFADEEYFRSISPLFHADRIRRPLLVLQGANDPRVLRQESDDIVAAVRANGVPVEYLVFEDEGHGFEKKANQERGHAAVLEFLDRYLREAG